MARIKKRQEGALLAKAVAVFSKHKHVVTGFILSRRELRKLECMKVIEKRIMRTDAGSIVYVWGMVRMPKIAAANDLQVPEKQLAPNMKPGFFYRLRWKPSKNKYNKEER